jgi:hypothetical protein
MELHGDAKPQPHHSFFSADAPKCNLYNLDLVEAELAANPINRIAPITEELPSDAGVEARVAQVGEGYCNETLTALRAGYDFNFRKKSFKPNNEPEPNS